MRLNPNDYKVVADRISEAIKERKPKQDRTKVPVDWDTLERAVTLLREVEFYTRKRKEAEGRNPLLDIKLEGVDK